MGGRKLSKVAEALAVARAQEERQPGEGWKALNGAGLPRDVHSVARSILWKRLPLTERMHRTSVADPDRSARCANRTEEYP